jgi:multimeric flavodoxin WrbA
MLITAVIGSYKKGNTLKVVRQIEERMKNHGSVEFKYIFLTDINLSQCKGCFVCLAKGENLCPHKDSLLDIEKQLMESDGAIFASPNYACGMTSLMKKLIERFAYIGHRPRFFGRYAAVVATSGGPSGLKQTLQGLSYFAGGGYTIVSKLGLMTPPVVPSAGTLKQTEKKINACADRLYAAIHEKKVFRPTFDAMMQFAAFRGMYIKNPALGEAKFPADMKYWRERGWLDKRAKYFLKMRIGVVKRAFGLLFEKVIGLAAVGMRPDSSKTEEA